MSAGYVYILTSEAHPTTLKIGHTTRTVEERRRELSRQTGVLYEFKVAHSESVPNSHLAEKRIHRALRSYRVRDRKEFFNVSIEVARSVVVCIAQRLRNDHEPKPRPATPTAFPKQQTAPPPRPLVQRDARSATQSDDAPNPVSYEKSVARMLAERRDPQRRMQQLYWLLLGIMIFVACVGLFALLTNARKASPARSVPPLPLKRALR